jgi:glycosyltransferase involved in cell wall biosynthesis
MKIAWVSSWPPRHCGIATYSAELVEALRKERSDVHIICHPDGGSPGERNVYPVLDTERHGWDEALYQTVRKIRPDVVHIQHEFGLYRTSDDYASGLLRPLFRWKIEGKAPVVVTYHSVYMELSTMIRTYMDVMQRLTDGGIVHALYQWTHLHVNLGRIVENMYVIPHGAAVRKPPPKDGAKEALGLEDKRVVGMLGWFTPTKGFHRVLSQWAEISRHLGPGTVLVLAGDARQGDPNQIDYKRKLLNLVEESGARDSVRVLIGSFSPGEYERILASFDAMVMPYSFASQSGNLAHSFSLGVPVVASGLEGLKAELEASGAGIAVTPGDDIELRRAILTIMEDDELRSTCRERALRYVRECISWHRIARKHLALYRKMVHLKERVSSPSLRDKALLDGGNPV